CFAERDAWHEVERDRRGDKKVLVGYGERRMARLVKHYRRERYHRLIRRTDRSTRRNATASHTGQRIVGQVACRIVSYVRRRGDRATAVRRQCFADHYPGQRLGRLRTADRTSAGADIDLV